jgi:hypothetical protein
MLNVRHIRLYATGIPDNMMIEGALTEKVTCAAFFTDCHNQRKSPLNNGNGFFVDGITAEGALKLAGEHCAYQFVGPDPVKATSIVHNISGQVVNLGSSDFAGVTFSKDTKIEKNYDEWSACVAVLTKRVPLHTLFKGLQKPTMENLSQSVEIFTAIFHKQYDENAVEVTAEVAEAAKRRRKPPSAAPKAPAAV